jgi:DNA-binding MarR family transcriptional regulator
MNSKTISGQALRDQILERMKRAPASIPDAWVQALAAQGNRDLLGLIALKQPQSISELSELAGRAQPNVSRSLSALIQAGLIEVRTEGRASIPTLTSLGRDKARELRLVAVPVEPVATPADRETVSEFARLSIVFANRGSEDSDAIPGGFVLTIPSAANHESVVAKHSGDINAVVLRLLDNWWRILYRRDAPYKIGEFVAARSTSRRQVSLAVKSMGDRIEQIVRWADDAPVSKEQSHASVSLDTFKQNLLDDVVRPAVAEMRSRRRYDRPIQSRLTRLEDTMSYKQESAFARTVGALGDSPYNLTGEWAQKVRDLIADIPDEEARLDFCSAVLRDGIDEAEAWTRAEISKQGEHNAMPELCELSNELHESAAESGARPYRRGLNMASKLRKRLNLAPDASIADVSGLAAMFGAEGFQPSPAAPGALRAFQCQTNRAPTIVVQKESAANTKFVLARAIGDFLVFRNRTSCVADLYTDRQAVGRAFAAEFIAPAEGVVRMIEDDDQPVKRVADHYGAPEHVIHHQYNNNNNAWRLVEA